MKDLYIAPELEILGFIAEEKLARQIDFEEMPTATAESAVTPNDLFDIDVDL